MRGLPATFWYLWVGALVNRLGGFVYTFLALYLTQARHLTVAQAGLIVSLYGAGSVAAGPVGGFLADRFGRRVTMLAGYLLGAAAMLQLGFARARWHIIVSTLLLGFLTDIYRPAQQATIADVVPPAERTRAYGYHYWAVNLGFAGAAMIAGWLADVSYTLLFVGDAATTLLCGIIVFWKVPETHPERHVTTRARPDPRAPFRDGSFVAFLAAQFLCVLVFAQSNATLPIDMRAHGVSPKIYGTLIAVNGLMIVLLQPTAIGIVQRFRRTRVLAVGALLTGAGFGLCAIGHTPGWYALVIVVFTLGELAFSPVTPTVVADLAPPSLRGTYQGALQMMWGLSACLAPAIGGPILGRFGSRALWAGSFALTVVSAALHLLRHDRRVSADTAADKSNA
jgi:MFS family permease